MAHGSPGIDILGNNYGPGDTVAAAINSYVGPTLLVGEVLEIGDRIKVRPIGRTNTSWSNAMRPSMISPARVVKLNG